MKAKLLAVALMGACFLASGCSQGQEVRSNRGAETKAKTQNEAERVEKVREQFETVLNHVGDWYVAAYNFGLDRDLDAPKYRKKNALAFNSDQKCEPGKTVKVTTLGVGVDEDDDLSVEDQSVDLMTIVGPDSYRGAVVTDYCDGRYLIEAEIDKSALPELAGLRFVIKIDFNKTGSDDFVVKTFDASNTPKWDRKIVKDLLKMGEYKDANRSKKKK